MKLLEEEIRELEALEEVHEQLVESNHELEMDLREELDMEQAARREVISDLCKQNSTFNLSTLTNFRCNVKKMQPLKRL